ncbi:uncharacterized protein LOC128390087 [Panonychus citri]|uniref:uncharacterized protein LOC128390087 n=1 Tax=Panonychus citri TaxID=50023 RepID=UPI0023075AF7|nr:uncharacterized protein LOC128390087 [Panonychus citri]
MYGHRTLIISIVSREVMMDLLKSKMKGSLYEKDLYLFNHFDTYHCWTCKGRFSIGHDCGTVRLCYLCGNPGHIGNCPRAPINIRCTTCGLLHERGSSGCPLLMKKVVRKLANTDYTFNEVYVDLQTYYVILVNIMEIWHFSDLELVLKQIFHQPHLVKEVRFINSYCHFTKLVIQSNEEVTGLKQREIIHITLKDNKYFMFHNRYNNFIVVIDHN